MNSLFPGIPSPTKVREELERLNLGRLRVLVTSYDDAKTPLKTPLTIEPEPELPGVRFDNNTLQPGGTQVELRVTASGAVKPGWFRLRAGGVVSPPIELKGEGGKDEE